jgi:hypothetical protein
VLWVEIRFCGGVPVGSPHMPHIQMDASGEAQVCPHKRLHMQREFLTDMPSTAVLLSDIYSRMSFISRKGVPLCERRASSPSSFCESTLAFWGFHNVSAFLDDSSFAPSTRTCWIFNSSFFVPVFNPHFYTRWCLEPALKNMFLACFKVLTSTVILRRC